MNAIYRKPKGEGVLQDNKQAFYWYKQAADKQNAKAIFKVGECYANGIGVKKDMEKANHWWALAEKCGIVEAKKTPKSKLTKRTRKTLQ